MRIILLICWVVTMLLSLTACSNSEAQEEKGQHGFGLFSWNDAVLAEEERETLSACIEQANISEIYQQFSENSLASGEAAAFITGLKEENIPVYALVGESEWAYDLDGESLIEALKPIADYNAAQPENARLSGIMVDVEPYLLEEWDEGRSTRAELMEGYLSCMESAYAYASEHELEFWACIPTFFDVTNEDILEALISNTCDGIAVMNYNREDEYGQIAKEVGFSREYGKKIICIYELQEAGSHDLEEINTYANEGLSALWQSADRLERQFGYEGLHFAYHYYEPLKTLLTQEQE